MPSPSCAQSLRIAIASSIPPSHDWFFWNTCMTTCGRRPSAISAERAWLKYASVYHPARIFSTGRSKMPGSSRCLRAVVRAIVELEREARGERGFRHLQLLRRRFGGREPVLERVPRPGKRLRDGMARVPRHPAEDLRGRGERAELRRRAGRFACTFRREAGENVPRRRRQHERPDEVSAAAL